MEFYNFGERLSDLRNEMYYAFKDLIEEKGVENVFEIPEEFNTTEFLEIGHIPIKKLEYSKASKYILFYMYDSDKEDFCLFSDFSDSDLAFFYDDLYQLLKMYQY